MEGSGVVSRQVSSFSGPGIDTHRPSMPFSGVSVTPRARPFGELRLLGRGNSGVSFRPPRRFSTALDSGFSDNAHIQYYVGPSCGEKKKKKEKKDKVLVLGTLSTKKKLKLLRGFANSLSKLSEMGFELDDLQEGLALETGNKMTPEGSEILLKRLEQLREEEKQIKRSRKQEMAEQKAERMQNVLGHGSSLSESSSSSSESSDSEYEGIIDMNRLRTEAHIQPKVDDLQPFSQQLATLPLPSLPSTCQGNAIEEHGLYCTKSSTDYGPCSIGHVDGSITVRGASATRIEVCMGNNCKKSGAAALLGEFERVMGVEGAVVGCKCMGKCRDGPNVRVLNAQKQIGVDDSFKTVANPLCIGVGLEDVDGIVAGLCGEERKHLSLAAA